MRVLNSVLKKVPIDPPFCKTPHFNQKLERKGERNTKESKRKKNLQILGYEQNSNLSPKEKNELNQTPLIQRERPKREGQTSSTPSQTKKMKQKTEKGFFRKRNFGGQHNKGRDTTLSFLFHFFAETHSRHQFRIFGEEFPHFSLQGSLSLFFKRFFEKTWMRKRLTLKFS